MLKNQKRLEDEQLVTMQILQTKDQEIERLRSIIKGQGLDSFEDMQGKHSLIALFLNLVTSPRQTVRHNLEFVHNELVRMIHKPEDAEKPSGADDEDTKTEQSEAGEGQEAVTTTSWTQIILAPYCSIISFVLNKVL